MMTEEPQTTARNDPRYAEGMAHLQNARWQEAIHCFEALARATATTRTS